LVHGFAERHDVRRHADGKVVSKIENQTHGVTQATNVEKALEAVQQIATKEEV